MKNKFLKTLFIVGLLFISQFTFAQNTDNTLKSTTVEETTFKAGSYELISPIGNLTEVKDQSENGFSDFVNLIIRIAIALAGAVAVLTIIAAGIQYMGSDSVWEKGESKSRMTTAIGGLILLFCSYLILYTINPDLVNIKIGGMKLNEGDWEDVMLQDSLVDNDTSHSNGQRICNSTAECKTICTTYCKNGKCDYKKPVTGVLDPAKAKQIENIKGISADSGMTASPSVIEGLKKLSGVFATENKGYSASIASAYRPINRQLEIACKNLSRVPSAVAYPGGSNHGTGVAVDIYLKQNGKSLSYCNNENSKKMDEMMTKAGWSRYTKEAWHYEYGVSASPTRCKFPNCPKATLCGK